MHTGHSISVLPALPNLGSYKSRESVISKAAIVSTCSSDNRCNADDIIKLNICVVM
jgi:hypothetical protein